MIHSRPGDDDCPRLCAACPKKQAAAPARSQGGPGEPAAAFR
jgi:hypothetical protein